ncbi:MAG: hypothetical protein ACF8XB_17000, partial [Planctomycetota bacterium JB042]
RRRRPERRMPRTADEDGKDGAARSDGRDAQGRFARGNGGGPGNPGVRRVAEYQRAVRESVTPERLELVLKRMVQRAVRDGDVQAARLVIERCMGRASLDPLGEGIPIELPPIRSLDDLLKAADVLLGAAVSGAAPAEAIEKLAGLVEGVRRVYETEVVAARLDELERELARVREGR